ncbi:MAG: M15 family metallopeptidase [Actinomycetes bacterium]
MTRTLFIGLIGCTLAASVGWAVAPSYSLSNAAAPRQTQSHLAPPAAPPSACRYSDKTTYFPQGSPTYAVLDTALRLPSGWKPASLVKISAGATLQPSAAKAWRDMRKAAKRAGVTLHAVSAYRSESYQLTVFNRNVRRHGRAHALKFVARPGHSEHQLGLTVDIGYAPGTAVTSEVLVHPKTRNQKVAAWLGARAWRYGWVRSYPKGKVAATCYESEPWHWRYVGPAKAADVRAARVTLRSYLWHLRPQ